MAPTCTESSGSDFGGGLGGLLLGEGDLERVRGGQLEALERVLAHPRLPCESGLFRTVHLSRHKWPGGLVN